MYTSYLCEIDDMCYQWSIGNNFVMTNKGKVAYIRSSQTSPQVEPQNDFGVFVAIVVSRIIIDFLMYSYQVYVVDFVIIKENRANYS